MTRDAARKEGDGYLETWRLNMTVAAYPTELEADVVLRTGRTLHVRPVRAEDRRQLLDFFARLSPQTMHARFFDLCSPDRALLYAPAQVDYVHDLGVIGESGGEIVAVAHSFVSRRNPKVAEVAFAIADAGQGCGIGTKLLEALIASARTHGIERFEADVLTSNQRMLDVFHGMGFTITTAIADGTAHLSFPIASTLLTEERAAERSQSAAAASMRAIFAPRSIAVVGASRRAGQLGNQIVRNLLASHFTGDLYVVNPKATEVESVPSYPTVSAIGGEVELAIIVVPAAQVEVVLDDCIAKRVSALVVISAGFSETGPEGRAAERRLRRRAGPACAWSVPTAWG